jgi:hypothetical protein
MSPRYLAEEEKQKVFEASLNSKITIMQRGDNHQIIKLSAR